jgi:hypothetical protein
VAEASLSELERLNTRLEDLEAKCLYCGGKMETVIATLQDEIPELPNLEPDTENTLLLAIAGLKQVCTCIHMLATPPARPRFGAQHHVGNLGMM